MTALLVLAKEPVPGRVKTRLCPPLTPEGAAAVATAALEDTLAAAREVDVTRRVLVLDGTYAADGFEVLPQVAGPMDARLAAAFDAVAGAPALLVGMDTPQLTAALLQQALDALAQHDAVLGLAPDGRWTMRTCAGPAGCRSGGGLRRRAVGDAQSIADGFTGQSPTARGQRATGQPAPRPPAA